jgi:hypothetical protein
MTHAKRRRDSRSGSPESALELVSAPAVDPIRSRVPLRLSTTFHPVGFPLEIATNTSEVLAAAGELWSPYPRLSRSAPLRLEVAVEGEGPCDVGPIIVRGREHLVAIAQPPANLAVADLSRGFAWASLTRNAVARRDRFRYFFLEPLVYLMVDARHAAPLHAACISLAGSGVLLCGASGAGKTSLAYACARRGWSYLSDDATHLLRRARKTTVAGRPHRIRFRASASRLFPELNAFPPVLRPSGKWDIEIESSRLGLAPACRAEAKALVFLNRRPDLPMARLSAIPRKTARRTLEEVVCYGTETMRARQLAALGRVLELPMLELRYHDFSEAERELRTLVETQPVLRHAR